MSKNVSATLTAAAATLLGTTALIPVYGGLPWLPPTLLAIAFVAAIGTALRKLKVPKLAIPAVQTAATAWATAATTTGSLQERAANGIHLLRTGTAPLEPHPDTILVTALAIAVVAIAVDTLASTYDQAAWAGLPLLLLYSVPATTTHTAWSAIAFVPAATGYVLLLTNESRRRLTATWGNVGTTAKGRTIAALGIGAAIIVPAIVPTWPGLDQQYAGSGGRGGSGGTYTVGDPIADLRRDLTRSQDIDLLRYTTTGKSDYLRLVVLDEYANGRWSISDRSVQRGKLPPPPGLAPTTKRQTVDYRISTSRDFDSTWLPLPYPVTGIQAPITWAYDQDTLDVAIQDGATKGIAYQVKGLSIENVADDLAEAGAPPDDLRQRYTALPKDIPAAVAQQANAIVAKAGAKTPYEKAAALQQWFLSDFTYDTSVVPDDGNALLEFLRDKRGYCEQFAATMAIMARQLGIPARVAVGFLPGDKQGETYVVSAHDAHAWPELYFEGHGWVRFEPTPRGGLTDPITSDPGATNAPSPSPTTTSPTGNAPEDDKPTPRDDTATPVAPTNDDGPNTPLALLAAAAVVLLALPAGVRAAVRRSRLRRAEPASLVDGVWAELADTMRDLRLGWNKAATPRATGRQLATLLPTAARPELEHLVSSVERVRYARSPGTTDHLPTALASVTAQLRAGQPLRRRLLAALLPASIAPKRRKR